MQHPEAQGGAKNLGTVGEGRTMGRGAGRVGYRYRYRYRWRRGVLRPASCVLRPAVCAGGLGGGKRLFIYLFFSTH